jgi:hypothetical protein
MAAALALRSRAELQRSGLRDGTALGGGAADDGASLLSGPRRSERHPCGDLGPAQATLGASTSATTALTSFDERSGTNRSILAPHGSLMKWRGRPSPTVAHPRDRPAPFQR